MCHDIDPGFLFGSFHYMAWLIIFTRLQITGSAPAEAQCVDIPHDEPAHVQDVGLGAMVGVQSEAEPIPDVGDMEVAPVSPVQLVGNLTDLIRELDDALALLNSHSPMSPQSSCCTSLRSWDLEITVSQNRDDYCTTEFEDVDSGDMSDGDTLIYCCGMYRTVTETYPCIAS